MGCKIARFDGDAAGLVNGLFAASKLGRNGQNAVGWLFGDCRKLVRFCWLGFVGLVAAKFFCMTENGSNIGSSCLDRKCKNKLNATLRFSRQVFVLLLVQGVVKWPKAFV